MAVNRMVTFLAHLAASSDHNAQMLAADLSGLADGANDLAVVVAYLRATLDGFEQAIALAEAECQWRAWRRTVKDFLTVGDQKRIEEGEEMSLT
jgi:putative N-acetylmannosamine-6-phosphate epimerase